MKELKILTSQDVSCYGQCSLTVALPILSALGIETAILPTAILSTHTMGFKDFTFRDLQEDLPRIEEHWEKEGIVFDALYTGYLGSKKDVDALIRFNAKFNRGPLFVDPAFGDHGRLYPGFDLDYVEAMKRLVSSSDILLPNLTEAAYLLGRDFNPGLTLEELPEWLSSLQKLGPKVIVLKGVVHDEIHNTGVALAEGERITAYYDTRAERDYHGTGDIFASVFVGASMLGLSKQRASILAANFVKEAIKKTLDDPLHPYGVKFEPLLTELSLRIRKEIEEEAKNR